MSTSHPDQPAIETRGLLKRFGREAAVDGVDLTVARGSIYGLLGPNGAGKTTTVRLLATLLAPDGGCARVLGHDVVGEPARVRERISLTGQFASVDEDLSGRENLRLLGRLLGYPRADARARADELLRVFELDQAAGRQVRDYSGGMRRRLDIAASLVSTPELLFLDEPTTGLDPRSRNRVWDTVRALAAHGTTVLLTTQYLEEADRLADRIAVIDRGRVIAEGSSAELKASVGSGVLHVQLAHRAHRDAACALLHRTLAAPVHAEADPAALAVQLERTDTALQALQTLREAGFEPASFALGRPSLDEVFFALTGHGAVERPPGPAAAGAVQAPAGTDGA